MDWVPLARILKPHAYKKDSFPYKAELFHTGGEIFRGRKSIFLAPPPLGDSLVTADWQEYKLSEEASPLGAKWGQATGLVVNFAVEPKTDVRGYWVALPRKDFPKVQGEVYLCDMMGAEVFDETGKSYGVIHAFFYPERDPASISLQVKAPGGDLNLEFPWAWIDFEASNFPAAGSDSALKAKCVVPDLGVWKKL